MIEITPNAALTFVRLRKLYRLPCGSYVFLDRIKTIKVIDRSNTEYKSLLHVEMEVDIQNQPPLNFIGEYDSVQAAQEKADSIAAAVNEYYRSAVSLGGKA